MKSEIRVLRRFKRAQEEALDALADQVADEFLSELARLDLFSEKKVSQALETNGLSAEHVNSIAEGKTAGPMVRALGGLVLRGLWHALLRPFLVLGKVIRSSSFRQEIKEAFKKALRRDIHATKQLVDVTARWARGDEVSPQEFKAAKEQLLKLLIKVVLLYFAAPGVTGLFTGGVWHAVRALSFSAEEMLVVLLDRPLSAVAHKLKSTHVT